MIPGDSAVLETYELFQTMLSSPGGTGIFDETYEISASLPPQPHPAGIPSQVGWLIGGVLIGLGIKVLRRPGRRGLAA